MELWQQLVSSNQGLLKSSSPALNNASKGAIVPTDKGTAAHSNSVDDFVSMECELSCQMCIAVDSSIASLKKVLLCLLFPTYS